MGELKDKMKKDMELKNLSKRTIKTYLICVKNYARHYRKSPELMDDNTIVTFKKSCCSILEKQLV
jgi:integrase/recombinase XerD